MSDQAWRMVTDTPLLGSAGHWWMESDTGERLHTLGEISDRLNTLEAQARRANEWLEWARDLATVHWVLSEANHDDLPQMVQGSIRQMLTEWTDPAVSEVVARAARAERLEAELEAMDDVPDGDESGDFERGWRAAIRRVRAALTVPPIKLSEGEAGAMSPYTGDELASDIWPKS